MRRILSILFVLNTLVLCSSCRQSDKTYVSSFNGENTYSTNEYSSVNIETSINIERCSVSNCENDTYDDSLYCFKHKCIIIHCKNEKCDGFWYCAEHKCATSTCQYQKMDGDFCSVCILDNKNSYQNQNATSNISTTTNNASTYNIADNTPYREKCNVDGCNENAFKDGVCNGHIFEVCQNSYCYQFRVDGGYFCVDHTCHYSGCISQADNNPNFYCNIHWDQLQSICVVEGCTAYKLSNSEYCYEHKKQYVCNHVNCENILDGSSSYCKTHKCDICPNEKLLSSNYCSRHTCSCSGCKNPASGYPSNYPAGNYYCSIHKCKVQGCYNMKSLKSEYCIFHYQ